MPVPTPATAPAANVVEDSSAPPVAATNSTETVQRPRSSPTAQLAPRLEGRRFYVVQDDPRESLWERAADLLGPRATDADVNAEWQRIYRLNSAVIGTDPGIIIPGMKPQLH